MAACAGGGMANAVGEETESEKRRVIGFTLDYYFLTSIDTSPFIYIRCT